MRAITDRFSRLFDELYSTTDHFLLVVRGHLYCESILTHLIEAELPKPDALGVHRIEYSRKVALADSLGLLSPAISAGLKKLGELRNKYVHRLDYEVQEGDLSDMVNAMKSHEDPAVAFYFRRNMEFPNGLRRCVLALWMPLQLRQLPDGEQPSFIADTVAHAAGALDVPKEEFLSEMKREMDKYNSHVKRDAKGQSPN